MSIPCLQVLAESFDVCFRQKAFFLIRCLYMIHWSFEIMSMINQTVVASTKLYNVWLLVFKSFIVREIAWISLANNYLVNYKLQFSSKEIKEINNNNTEVSRWNEQFGNGEIPNSAGAIPSRKKFFSDKDKVMHWIIHKQWSVIEKEKKNVSSTGGKERNDIKQKTVFWCVSFSTVRN